MKTLDLTQAKWLKKFLSVRYNNWQINGVEGDICTLTRMCLVATIGWFGVAGFLILVGGVICAALTPLLLLSMLLPVEVNPVPLALLDYSSTMLAVELLIVAACLIFCMILAVCGKVEFAPEYITKHFRKEDVTPKEKKPSQTWIAVKEMYKSFKDKTCIKVKM